MRKFVLGKEYTTQGDSDHGIKPWPCRIGGDNGKMPANRFGQFPVMHFTPFVRIETDKDGHTRKHPVEKLVYHNPDGTAVSENEAYDISA